MSATTVTVEAENAAALLFQTLGAHRTAVARLRPRPLPRLGVGRANDAEHIQCQSTLVRLLSITESFASELLLREVDKVIARSRSVAVNSLWDEAAVRGTNSWREQQTSYRDWLGVTEDWTAVERLAEARNAVAHGLGTLTRRQLRKERSVRDKLKKAGISLIGIRIVLSDAALASAASACRDLINRIDLAVQARPSQYR